MPLSGEPKYFAVLGKAAWPRKALWFASGSSSMLGEMISNVQQAFPVHRALTDSDFADLEDINRAAHLVFGDERVIDYFATVSRLLLRPQIARSNPELAALGFFLRRSQLCRMLTGIGREPAQLRMPRGLVCQFTPANIPVIFGYSWALSALAGNVNVVRLSSRDSPSADILIDALGEALSDAAPVIALTQRLLRYGHDDSVTALLSRLCDLRVIWGGDDTVAAIRRQPLAPRARDLTFPDRVSFAVISAAGWLRAGPDCQEQAVRRFYNDSYLYDQAACASPLTVYWIGEPDIALLAQQAFLQELAALVAVRGPALDTTTVIDKYVRTYSLGLMGEVTSIRFLGNALTILDMPVQGSMLRSWSGPGVFAFGTAPALAALVPAVGRRHQTVAHFGFSGAEITEFATALRGRGVDRLVPAGEALLFDAVWDGYELLREFSRVMTVR